MKNDERPLQGPPSSILALPGRGRKVGTMGHKLVFVIAAVLLLSLPIATSLETTYAEPATHFNCRNTLWGLANEGVEPGELFMYTDIRRPDVGPCDSPGYWSLTIPGTGLITTHDVDVVLTNSACHADRLTRRGLPPFHPQPHLDHQPEAQPRPDLCPSPRHVPPRAQAMLTTTGSVDHPSLGTVSILAVWVSDSKPVVIRDRYTTTHNGDVCTVNETRWTWENAEATLTLTDVAGQTYDFTFEGGNTSFTRQNQSIVCK